jgi:hypothetical protein
VQYHLFFVFEDHFPVAVPLLHGGSYLFRWRPITSGIPNFPMSVPMDPSDIAAVCRLCPLFPFYLPGASAISASTSVLSGFLLQNYKWSDSFVSVRLNVLHVCVPETRVPCTVPLLHSGSSTIFLGQNFPEDVSLATCYCCTAEHLPAGGSQLPPESTIPSGQFHVSPRRPAARCRPPCSFFRPPTGFTTPSSIRTS